MPLVTQQGSVADRIRNFFRVTGRIPAQLDETVVPVASVQSLDQPPWRTEDGDFAALATQAAAVGVNSHIGVRLPGRTPGVAIVTGFHVRNLSGVAAEFSLNFVAAAEGFASFGIITPCLNTEHLDPTVTAFAQSPAELCGFTTAPIAGFEIGRFVLPNNETIQVRVRVCLRGHYSSNPAASQGLFVVARLVNSAVTAGFSGTYYPSAL